MSVPGTAEKILVLRRAVPEESKKYFRTVCVAGITDAGHLRRIYPVVFKPFQPGAGIPFHKKEWMGATVLPPEDKRDKRPESRKIDSNTVRILNKADDNEIRSIVVAHLSPSVKAIAASGASLGFIKPKILEFDCIVHSTEELDKNQVDVFGRVPGKIKLGQESRYKFYCEKRTGCCERRPHNMEIHDWEANELFRSIIQKEKKSVLVRQKMKARFYDWMVKERDMYFMMGTHHVFKTWMIVSVLYLRKP